MYNVSIFNRFPSKRISVRPFSKSMTHLSNFRLRTNTIDLTSPIQANQLEIIPTGMVVCTKINVTVLTKFRVTSYLTYLRKLPMGPGTGAGLVELGPSASVVLNLLLQFTLERFLKTGKFLLLTLKKKYCYFMYLCLRHLNNKSLSYG